VGRASGNYLNDTTIMAFEINATGPSAEGKPPLHFDFACRHNAFVPRYKNASGTYSSKNPYNKLYPKCIIDRYSLEYPGDPIPYFSGKRNAVEDYLNATLR
jgi:hypothetical protein